MLRNTPFRVHRHRVVPGIFVDVGECHPERAGDSRGVDRVIEPAKARDGSVHQRLDIGTLSHVGRNEQPPTTGGFDPPQHVLALLGIPCANRYVGSVARETKRAGNADTGASASNKDDFIPERIHLRPSGCHVLEDMTRNLSIWRHHVPWSGGMSPNL
jgi:hypothetical protein